MSQPLIVVGVDGSPESKHALAWAAEHAARTGGTLRANFTLRTGRPHRTLSGAQKARERIGRVCTRA